MKASGMIKTVLALTGWLLLVTPAAWSQQQQGPVSIIGGTNVPAGSVIASHVVGLIVSMPEGEALCTASLVSNALAVTAAHCVSDEKGNPLDPSQLVLVFGQDIHNPQTLKKRVTAAAAFPQYQARQAHAKNTGDIALIKFDGGLPPGYAPTPILPDPNGLQNGQVVTLAGFGITDGTTQAGAGVLRQVTVSIMSAKFSVSEIELDQTKGAGACHGDSGGPAYLQVQGQLYLWGVTSRAVKDQKNDCTQYSAYTDVLYYMSWLNQEAKTMATTFPSNKPIAPILMTGIYQGGFFGPPNPGNLPN